MGYAPSPLDVKQKDRNARYFAQYMLARTLGMFKWKGLPDTLPALELERILQTCGSATICRINDPKLSGIFAFPFVPGGDPLDVYRRPTKALVTSPVISKSYTFTIGEDCVRIRNDACVIGLMPIFTKYGSLLAENELSIRNFDIVTRLLAFIIAETDKAKADAEKVLAKLADGDLGVFSGSAVFEGLKTSPLGSASSIVRATDYIEIEQYLKAAAFNEVGIDANFNMKREALNSSESALNDAALLPLVDNMRTCRDIACDDLRRVLGIDASVDFASVWEDQQEIANAQPAATTKGGENGET